MYTLFTGYGPWLGPSSHTGTRKHRRPEAERLAQGMVAGSSAEARQIEAQRAH